MITVRRDAVRTQGRAPEGGGDQQSRRGCQMRHFCHRKHFEITGHTKPTFPCQQHPCHNAKVVPASTVVTGRNSSVLKVSLAARQCQRLRSTKVSIRSRSSACSRLVSTERPHRNLTDMRIPIGSMTGRLIHVITAIPACPVRPKGGHSANARAYEYMP